MNAIVNRLLLAQDIFMAEMHLTQKKKKIKTNRRFEIDLSKLIR